MKHPQRTIAEIELLSTQFGDVQFDPYDPTVVKVLDFDLPSGFNRDYSLLLIVLNENYPEYAPQDIYLDTGLRRYGNKPTHYFENFTGKKYCDYGYAWYSFHITSWRCNPYSMIRGDNLLTVAEAVFQSLRSD
jgi:hypothetical protein